MKKLLVVLLISIFAFNANAKLTKIDFKWTKVISFNAIALSEEDFNNGKIGIIGNGKVLICYDDFGSAGSLCEVSINAGEKFKGTSLDGSKIVKLEDVNIYYDSTKESLVIQNKLRENLVWIIGNNDIKILLFYDIIPFLVTF